MVGSSVWRARGGLVSAVVLLTCLLGQVDLATAGRPRYAEAVAVERAPGEQPQVDSDRPGGDFLSVDLPAPEPAVCESLCRRHKRCRAYTFVRPGLQGSMARCWLKSQVSAPVANSCCVSGVVGSPRPFDGRVPVAQPGVTPPAGLPTLAPRVAAPKPRAIPLLLVLAETPATRGRLPLTQSLDFYDKLVFGSQEPSVVSFFESNANGRFFFVRAGAIGPLPITTPVNTEEHADVVEAAVKAGFSFWDYDFNLDGRVDENELIVLAVSNHGRDSGAARRVCRNVGSRGLLENIDLCPTDGGVNVAAVGHLGETYNTSHELMHTLGTTDLYGPGGAGECWNGGYTLMGCARGGSPHQRIWTHLDPWHKIRLGWAAPRYVSTRAPAANYQLLAPMGADERPMVLFDPQRPREFYVLEYRHPRTADGWDVYDRHSACPGVVTWYLRVNEIGQPEEVRLLRTGRDRFFQSTLRAGDRLGLDVKGVRYIDPGADGQFQSELVIEEIDGGTVKRAGDRIDNQKLLFVARVPADIGARGEGPAQRGLTPRDGTQTLRWMDGTVATRLDVGASDAAGATVWLGGAADPVPPHPPAPAASEVQAGATDYIGCDIGVQRAADAAACAQICRNNPRCGAYTFVTPDGNCFAKYGAGGALPNPRCSSGSPAGR